MRRILRPSNQCSERLATRSVKPAYCHVGEGGVREVASLIGAAALWLSVITSNSGTTCIASMRVNERARGLQESCLTAAQPRRSRHAYNVSRHVDAKGAPDSIPWCAAEGAGRAPHSSRGCDCRDVADDQRLLL